MTTVKHVKMIFDSFRQLSNVSKITVSRFFVTAPKRVKMTVWHFCRTADKRVKNDSLTLLWQLSNMSKMTVWHFLWQLSNESQMTISRFFMTDVKNDSVAPFYGSRQMCQNDSFTLLKLSEMTFCWIFMATFQSVRNVLWQLSKLSEMTDWWCSIPDSFMTPVKN